MDNKKQTSIEWLFEQLPTIDKNDPYYKDIFNTAKNLHKYEIQRAYMSSLLNTMESEVRNVKRIYCEEYYNLTYGGGDK